MKVSDVKKLQADKPDPVACFARNDEQRKLAIIYLSR